MSPRASLDSSALAGVFASYRRYGIGRFTPPEDLATRSALARAVTLGWLWEPRPGTLALTPAGLEAIGPYRTAGDLP